MAQTGGSEQNRKSNVNRAVWYAPFALSAAFMVVLGILLWMLFLGSFERRQAGIREAAEHAASSIGLHLEGNREYLLLLAEEMSRGALDEAEFQRRTSQYVADHPGLINVTWADKDFIIRWTAPYEPNKTAVGIELTLPEQERASHLARETGKPVWTRPFEVIQGAPAFEIYVPVFKGDEFLGAFGGVYALEKILKYKTLEFIHDSRYLALTDEEGNVLYGLPPSRELDMRFAHRVALDQPGYGVSLMLTDYARGLPWGIVAPAFFCAALALALSLSMVPLRRELAEHRQAEEALRESGERYRTIVDNSLTGIYISQDRKFIFINKRFTELSGYTEEDLLGKPTEDLIYSEDKELVKKALEKRLAGENAGQHYEYRVLNKGGDVRWIEIFGARIDYQGEPAILASFIDITDRKRAESALRESEERYRLHFENVGDVIYSVDREMRVTSVSPSVERALGYKPEEIIGRSIGELELIAPEYLEQAFANTKRVLAGKHFDSAEYEFIAKDGSRVFAEVSAAPIFMDGKIIGGIDVARDVTGHRRLEERLRQAEKLEAIGTLAGGVAHDLNNILSGITGYPELLLLKLPADSPMRDALQIIKNSGEKAAAIVQDMLTLARSGVPITDVVNINDTISEYLESPVWEKVRAFHPNVQLKTELEAGLLNINGSPTHLSEVVMNLVSNAAEAMPSGGQLLIRTENRYLDKPIEGYDSFAEGEYATISISDTGVGLTPEDAQRIFEPFYTKKAMGRSGTGLGATIVWRTVKDHGGYIDVQIEKESGTTFTLYFPITREKISGGVPGLSMEGYMGTGQFILIVDDVKEQRELAAGMLETLGYSAKSVSSGEEAIEYLESNSADLLILDMIMEPGIDGLETYRKIIELHPNQKAIIASGFSETEKVKEAQALGAGAYIRKPYTIETIGMAVRKELEK